MDLRSSSGSLLRAACSATAPAPAGEARTRRYAPTGRSQFAPAAHRARRGAGAAGRRRLRRAPRARQRRWRPVRAWRRRRHRTEAGSVTGQRGDARLKNTGRRRHPDHKTPAPTNPKVHRNRLAEPMCAAAAGGQAGKARSLRTFDAAATLRLATPRLERLVDCARDASARSPVAVSAAARCRGPMKMVGVPLRSSALRACRRRSRSPAKKSESTSSSPLGQVEAVDAGGDGSHLVPVSQPLDSSCPWLS